MIFGGPRLSSGHHIARGPAELAAMVREMQEQPVRGLDFETRGLRYTGPGWRAPGDRDHPIGYSVGYLTAEGAPRVWYVPIAHQTADNQVDPDTARQAFKDALAGASALVGHHLKFDLNMGRANGYEIDRDVQIHCTNMQAYLIYEKRSFKLERLAEDVVRSCQWDDPYEMSEMVANHCRHQAKLRGMTYKRDDKEARKPSYLSVYGHAEVPVQIEAEYSCRDIAHTMLLDRLQRPQAMGEGEQYEARRKYLYWNEMLLVRALAEMEYTGQLVDAPYLLGLAAEIDEKLEVMARDLTRAFSAGIDFKNDNVLRDFLYNHLKLPVVKLTDRGKKPAVDRSALQQLRAHETVKRMGLEDAFAQLIEHSAWYMARKTFTTSLAWRVDGDGRIHASFRQAGAGSGRLSSADPNLQNIPSRHAAIAEAIRRAFYLMHGYTRVYVDYSQVELRVLAHVTGNTTLTTAYQSESWNHMMRECCGEPTREWYDWYRKARAFEANPDVHSIQATNTFGAKPSDGDFKAKRGAAKIINFGVPYGMGSPGLMTNPELMLSKAKADEYFEKYHFANPEIATTKAALFAKMLTHPVPHFVNWAGRTVHARSMKSKDRNKRGEGERSAFASLIQGTAAELTRFSLVRWYLAYRAGSFPAVATSTIHDEIQFDGEHVHVPYVASESQAMMEDYHGRFGSIPVVTNLETTRTNWAEKEDYP